MATRGAPKRRSVTRTRVGLTGRDLDTESGVALLERLEAVWVDGIVGDDEAQALADWLEAAATQADLPGLHFLHEEVTEILADGIVSEPEKRLLRDAILRVLPTTERERARARFAEAAAAAREARRQAREVEANRATAAQRDYIAVLGGTCGEDATLAEASALIDSLLATRPTPRQLMVLRFWNRLDLRAEGVVGVSAWMDQWYTEDPDRKEAWALWKREIRDDGDGTAYAVERVPIGAGDAYLARIKEARATAAAEAQPLLSGYGEDQTRPRRARGVWVVVGLAALLALSLWWQ